MELEMFDTDQQTQPAQWLAVLMACQLVNPKAHLALVLPPAFKIIVVNSNIESKLTAILRSWLT